MNRHVIELFTIEEVALRVNVSVSNFYRQFVDEMGVTPADYRNRIRIDKAKELLLQDETLSVTRIAHELGFSTSQYLSTVFRKYTGMSPTENRQTGDLLPLAEEPVVYK